MLFDSLSVLVVRGGAVCLPTPPSWFSQFFFFFLNYFIGVQSQLSEFAPHHSPPAQPSPPSYLHFTPLDFVHVPFIVVPENSSPSPPLPPHISPLVTVRLFLISMSHRLYYPCLFVLVISFQLKVRSYGICPSLPGLFHLAECSPFPSMLLQRVYKLLLSLCCVEFHCVNIP